MKIGTHVLGPSLPVFCIAEIGVNHNGDIELAKKLIGVAVAAGADAVKFQTFRAEDLVTASAPMAEYQKANLAQSLSQLEMLKRYELSLDDHRELFDYATKKKIIFLSTPHSGSWSVDVLEKVGVCAYKVGSADITNFPLLSELAHLGKPLILSSGMSSLEEVGEAIHHLQKLGANDLVMLHCTSEYPCMLEGVNMKAMSTIRETFNVDVGYSDHTTGHEAAVLATRLGAVAIEKHITLDNGMEGPDHKASLNPNEFQKFVEAIRKERSGKEVKIDPKTISRMEGTGIKRPTTQELATAKLVRKSIVSTRAIKAGAAIRAEDIMVKRPSHGIQPKHLREIVGRVALRDIARDEVLQWTDLK